MKINCGRTLIRSSLIRSFRYSQQTLPITRARMASPHIMTAAGSGTSVKRRNIITCSQGVNPPEPPSAGFTATVSLTSAGRLHLPTPSRCVGSPVSAQPQCGFCYCIPLAAGRCLFEPLAAVPCWCPLLGLLMSL